MCSLKLAVLVILAIAIALSVGTVLESLYDTPTSQYWVYRALWFHGVLALLGVNILSVALSRYPWRFRHIPFLLAHLGILILLFGSWKTDRDGVDGNLRISEGEEGSIVELDRASLVIQEKDAVRSIPVKWVPPGVHFPTLDTAQYGWTHGLKVDRFLPHADVETSFLALSPSERLPPGKKTAPAVKIHLTGGPMQLSQDLWLWEGATEWKIIEAGPARFSMNEALSDQVGQPQLSFFPQADGSLSFLARSSQGKVVKGIWPKDRIVGSVLRPGWKGDVQIQVSEWIPQAFISTLYKESRIQWGAQAPTSAIHVSATPEVGVWLGLGDHAVLHLEGREIQIGYFPKRFVLPFSLKLEHFTVEHDPGTFTPAAYSSEVSVVGREGERKATISMNEPLEMGGYTVYQASYEDGSPRPITSIFSVNRDPGRRWKYLGSALIVLGSVLLFGAKYRGKKGSKSRSLHEAEVC